MTKEDLKDREGLTPDKDQDVSGGSEPDPATVTDTGQDEGGDTTSEAEEPEVESGPETGSEPQANAEGCAEPELQTLEMELKKLRDQHLRLAADFENHRKRATADRASVWVRAQADLVRSLVEGLDDLQRVSQFTSEDTTVDTLIEGVDLVERNLLKALTEAGLKVLNPEGERFDPNIMEAMMKVPAEEDGQDETVHQVFLKGYLFKDQLVRPARVSVFKDED